MLSRNNKPKNNEKMQKSKVKDAIPLLEKDDLENDKDHSTKSNLKGDYTSICILLFLYVLQGIPLGLANSLSFILQNRNVSYSQQAIFSFVNWPFSVKLLWAPIVDSIYIRKFGRRKSWLIPIQYLIGFSMIFISFFINNLIGDEKIIEKNIHNSTETLNEENSKVVYEPNVFILTFVFLFLNFLCATQDVAVDGWALTMLSRRNVIYASTCNTVGQTAGFFLGNMLFLVLESPDFSNKYLRSVPQKYGLVTLSGFIYFWGIVFFISTTLLMLLKSDKEHQSTDGQLNLKNTYKMLYKILKLKSIRTYSIIFLTCKIGFAVTDAATALKLTEAGVHKENIALIAIPMIPFQIILPWIISKYIKNSEPLHLFIKAYPYRLFFGIFFALIVKWTYSAKLPDGSFSVFYYFVVIIVYLLHQVSVYCMYVSAMSFNAKISNPAIGGTYMTLLNTVGNLGGNWPLTLALSLIDFFTIKKCKISHSFCMSSSSACNDKGDVCEKYIDGYYFETVICIIIGLVWFFFGKSKIKNMQNLSINYWKCK